MTHLFYSLHAFIGAMLVLWLVRLGLVWLTLARPGRMFEISDVLADDAVLEKLCPSHLGGRRTGVLGVTGQGARASRFGLIWS